jgi:putative DNA primase/helicase
MTLFRPTEDDYKNLDKELDEIKKRKAAEERKRAELRDMLALDRIANTYDDPDIVAEKCKGIRSIYNDGNGGNNDDGNGSYNNNGNGNGNGKRRRDEVLDTYYRKIKAKYTFKTLADSQEILWYDSTSGLYQFNGEVKIKEEIEKIFEEELNEGQITIANLVTEHDRKEIVNRIKWTTIIQRELFDNGHDNIINVKNGLLDIKSKELKPHSSVFLSTKQLPMRYDPSAKWTEVLKFLKQVQNREGVNTLLKMFGYILLTDTSKYQKAFFFAGRGDNGKSVLIDLIDAFVGKDNCSSVKLHDLKNDRFMAAQMYGKIVNTYADIPGTGLSDVGLFKALVSGDMITAQHKYGKPFKFRNRSKMIYSGNAIPLSEGEDDLAYFKRWVILNFEALFTNDKQDKDLIGKLTTDENLSGLLNLALVGLVLLERDLFEKVPIEVIREEYNRESESLRSFLHDDCTINLSKKEYYMIVDDFNSSYWQYCEERKLLADGEKPLSDGKIEIELAKQKIFKGRKQLDGVKRTIYKGIITVEEAAKRSQVILERQKQETL